MGGRTLDFVLTNVDRLPWTTICALLLEYFERGEVGEVSLELRGPADKNDPLYSLWVRQQKINARTLSETPETATTNTTLESLRQRAERGNASAQVNLGIAYANGEGVPQDHVQAVAWWRKAADQGLAAAQHNLGRMYANGEGVPQDYAQAMPWFRKAADQGLAAAQCNLGFMYKTGQGVPQDDVESVAWYRKAADQGDATAQFYLAAAYALGKGVPRDDAQGNASAQSNLGLMYENGEGVPQDYVEAHKWRNLAASRAVATNREQYAEARDALAKKMTPAQIAEAQKRATAWQAAFDAR